MRASVRTECDVTLSAWAFGGLFTLDDVLGWAQSAIHLRWLSLAHVIVCYAHGHLTC